jgi:superfamily II DNA or RNA helicase
MESPKMTSLTEILQRMDEPDIYELIGQPSLRLVKIINSTMPALRDLRAMAISSVPQDRWIREKTKRNLLISLLRPSEIRALSGVLGIPSLVGNESALYRMLQSKTFRKNSNQEQILFDFFAVPYPQEPAIESESVENLHPEYPLFIHQQRTLQNVIRRLATSRRVLLQMPTGSGKTRTAINIICDHLRGAEKSVVVWLAFSEELCEQACDEFKKAWAFLGNRPLGIHRFWGDHQFDPTFNDGLMVAGLTKVYSGIQKETLFGNKLAQKTKLVIIDEAHQATAPTYSLVLESLVVPFEKTKCLGLTATPGRTWNNILEDQRLADFFDRNKVTLQVPDANDPISYLTSNGFLANIKKRPVIYGDGKFTSEDLKRIENYLDIPSSLLEKIGTDEIRNALVYQEAVKAIQTHSRVLVFACSVESSNILAFILRQSGIVAHSLTSATTTPERNDIISRFRKRNQEKRVLINFGILTTGFDAPNTSCVIIARPTKSLVLYTQMVGRAIRGEKQGGNREAEIVTIIDQNLPGFRSIQEAFTHWDEFWENDND